MSPDAPPPAAGSALTAPRAPTVAGPVTVETVVKKSRFLAHLSPVTDVTHAESVITAVRKEHWDARHHCVAMIVGAERAMQRSSDDGEPSGTAGAPMLTTLQQSGLTDVVVVVTRWFGGTLLGTGGLVRAYSGAVSTALDAARILRRVRVQELTVDAPHAEAGRISAFLHAWVPDHGGTVLAPVYDDVAHLPVLVPPAHVPAFDAALAETTLGRATAVRGEVRVVERSD
ncbi:hypothetical protein GCM10025865_29120 [Paraoerskovia sediminicola]|uniref:YigZ family protein n=1 Tax=Paraoerskovia sediminicola TaxID=1138587 RepID=A0ABM8G623_9CELL|nr:YigZ family protein [Paraoerskovia sediminicola]BDZ43613.1 hypothetical protein GCM10025865_29120 [Paraoerskovia sediminicola]